MQTTRSLFTTALLGGILLVAPVLRADTPSSEQKCRVAFGKVATNATIFPPLSVHRSFAPVPVKQKLGPETRERTWSAPRPDEPYVDVKWIELSTPDLSVTLECGMHGSRCLLHSLRYSGTSRLPCDLWVGATRSTFSSRLGEPEVTTPATATYGWAEFFEGGATRGRIEVKFKPDDSSEAISWSYWAD